MAVARSASNGRYYAVQMFGRPARLRVRFVLSNRSASALRYAIDGQTYSLDRGETGWHERCLPPKLSVSLPGKDKPITLGMVSVGYAQAQPVRLQQGRASKQVDLRHGPASPTPIGRGARHLGTGRCADSCGKASERR